MKYYPTAIERMQMERPSEKRTKSQGQLIASWSDLMSQCGININVQKILYFMILTFHAHLVGGDQIHHPIELHASVTVSV